MENKDVFEQSAVKRDTIHSVTAALAAVIDRAELAKDEAQRGNLVEALKFYHFASEAYKQLDIQRKRLYHIVDEFDKAILPAKFDDEGTDLTRIPELARSFYTLTKHSAKTVDKDKLFDWLRGVGQGDVITETVNASTLAGVLKTLLEEQGIDPPEDVAVLTTYKTIGSSKYTPK